MGSSHYVLITEIQLYACAFMFNLSYARVTNANTHTHTHTHIQAHTHTHTHTYTHRHRHINRHTHTNINTLAYKEKKKNNKNQNCLDHCNSIICMRAFYLHEPRPWAVRMAVHASERSCLSTPSAAVCLRVRRWPSGLFVVCKMFPATGPAKKRAEFKPRHFLANKHRQA